MVCWWIQNGDSCEWPMDSPTNPVLLWAPSEMKIASICRRLHGQCSYVQSNINDCHRPDIASFSALVAGRVDLIRPVSLLTQRAKRSLDQSIHGNCLQWSSRAIPWIRIGRPIRYTHTMIRTPFLIPQFVTRTIEHVINPCITVIERNSERIYVPSWMFFTFIDTFAHLRLEFWISRN